MVPKGKISNNIHTIQEFLGYSTQSKRLSCTHAIRHYKPELSIPQVGGATAQVGDPSGRSKERPLLEPKVIESNSKGIAENLQRIFKNHQQVFWERGSEENLAPLRYGSNFSYGVYYYYC